MEKKKETAATETMWLAPEVQQLERNLPCSGYLVPGSREGGKRRVVDGGFYIMLLSNASARICPQRTSSNFTAQLVAQLVRSLELSSWWEVGLVKILYQHSWNSISKDTMSVIALQGKTWQYTLWKGYYPSPSRSTECMNHLNPHKKASSIAPSAVALVHDPIIR